MSTYDAKPIELTDENMQYTAAGRGLTRLKQRC
jgi:hypothetical protein